MITATKKMIRQLFLLVLPITAAVAEDSVSTPVTYIIDVRTESEWNSGHLEGAILIPHDRIESGITKLAVDRKTKIHLYCRSGRRTAIAVDALKKSGYLDVVNLGTMENASKVLCKRITK